MFIDPSNQSLGTQACVHGYNFMIEENEWNIIAEVTITRLVKASSNRWEGFYGEY